MTTLPPIVDLSDSPVPVGTTPQYTAVLVNSSGVPIDGSTLDTLTLTLTDTASGAIINDVSQVNILNTGRGTIDSAGVLTINLLATDTAVPSPLSDAVMRSLVIEWTYNAGGTVGRHQANITLVPLSEDETA